MKTAYSYVRFSSKKQATGDSLRRQKKATLEFCERHGLNLAQLSFEDLGVSAFRGKNRDEGALAAFIEGVKKGRIKRGSVLVIESLDRLSRDRLRPALIMTLQLIEAGITIATITPERFYDPANTDDISLVEMLLGYIRSNEESATKSKRVKEAYRERVSKAANGGGIISRRCPAWLRFDGKKFVSIPERKKVIQDIFTMAKKMGSRAIAKELNRKNVPTWGGGKAWGWAYVQLLLSDQRVLGHYIETKTKQIKVADYFPRIISDDDFEIVKNLRDKRVKWRGRIGKRVTNLFQGIIFDIEGHSMVTIKKRADAPSRLISSAFESGSQTDAVSFPYEAFENVFLQFVSDLTPPDIEPTQTVEDRTPTLEAELARVEGRSAELAKAISRSDRPIAALIEALTELEARKQKLAAELSAEKEKHRTPIASTLETARHIIDEMRRRTSDSETRLSLRAQLRSLIERIEVSILRAGWRYTLNASVLLKTGVIRRLTMSTMRGQLESAEGSAENFIFQVAR